MKAQIRCQVSGFGKKILRKHRFFVCLTNIYKFLTKKYITDSIILSNFALGNMNSVPVYNCLPLFLSCEDALHSENKNMPYYIGLMFENRYTPATQMWFYS